MEPQQARLKRQNSSASGCRLADPIFSNRMVSFAQPDGLGLEHYSLELFAASLAEAAGEGEEVVVTFSRQTSVFKPQEFALKSKQHFLSAKLK